MLVYKGINALTDFQRRGLLKQLQKINPEIVNISAEYVHFVDSSKLSPAQNEKLENLLTYDTPFTEARSGSLFLVIPRLGTISPWSSKATDIAHNCGLTNLRRVERGLAYYIQSETKNVLKRSELAAILHDRMTETVLSSTAGAKRLFVADKPRPVVEVPLLTHGKEALTQANKAIGLAISDEEIDYLDVSYRRIKRNPTDMELVMFAQINSEHCRHKIFNADWIIDSKKQPKSLFKMIRNTYEKGGQDVLSAYSDNAAVLRGKQADYFFPDQNDGVYRPHHEPLHLVTKVETHNHPTAIAPFPGAATGNGGEIRDEGATGRGAKPKMGLTGFSVSNLNLPGAKRPWEKSYGKPSRIASPLSIMIDAPLGGAVFNNEFGRPNLTGYFRTYEQASDNQTWGYHKPIMIAGGVGNIRDSQVIKGKLTVGTKLIVLGGPAMLIGLGGSTASSMQTGTSKESLDFASVQRGNGEMERRVQEVINACWSLDKDNPVISIHDVGAGGLSNALPEIVRDSGLGAHFELRNIPNAERGLSPMEIWCNEAQERYVVGLSAKDLKRFVKICERERCPYAVVGTTTKRERLLISDKLFKNTPVNLPMSVLFGKPPKMTRTVDRHKTSLPALATSDIKLNEAVSRVLHLPAVASKKFLITLGDRTVGGLTVRDQMVGPWQVPVSDVAVTAASFDSKTGEAMAMGERTPLALIDSPASARMAIGEALTNIAAAPIRKISDVKLSANWMAAAGHVHEDEKLYNTVKAVGEDFCPALGLTIPVGKDSLSMRTVWEDKDKQKSVTSPLSVIITGFAPVVNVKAVLTPQLSQKKAAPLLLIDLGLGKNRLGASALAQVYNQVGNEAPDVEAGLLKKFFATIQKLQAEDKILAYHDRSDGGLLVTLCEMAFASRSGLAVALDKLPGKTLDQLFNEELGVVIQVRSSDKRQIMAQLQKALGKIVYELGVPTADQVITIKKNNRAVYKNSRAELENMWADTSYRVQAMRDNPASAKQELVAVSDNNDPGISPKLTFTPIKRRPTKNVKVAIFREQGVNGQIEMAAAFHAVGFEAVDVHLNDLLAGTVSLNDFSVLAACGGFSYGDVLGAGAGWAKTILNNASLKAAFSQFFKREDTLSLGVCNGCQMLAGLKSLIPGAEDWPVLLRNVSEQFEARLVSVKIEESPSVLLKGMEGSIIPVPVAHGEGRMEFSSGSSTHVGARYVDNYGEATEAYPFNPNGSKNGVTAVSSTDGRATILMPHPERGFLSSQFSWHPDSWAVYGPWFQLFQNAYNWF